MIVGLYQAQSPQGDLSTGIEVASHALSRASEMQVDMLVLPEAFLPGYASVTTSPPAGWEEIEEQLSNLCKKYQTALTIGLPEHADGQVFNTALSLDANGDVLGRYRKVQLFGSAEKALYTPGRSFCVFDYRGKRFGLLICYDVEFPEHVRTLARMGVDVILVPTANMAPFVNVNQLIVPARAAENAITIVYANYCGSENDLDYVGMSGIFGPDGYLLAAKGTNEGLCIAELPDGWNERGIPLSTQIADIQSIEL